MACKRFAVILVLPSLIEAFLLIKRTTENSVLYSNSNLYVGVSLGTLNVFNFRDILPLSAKLDTGKQKKTVGQLKITPSH